jgi:DNA-binding XRE family transcriptional regulator
MRQRLLGQLLGIAQRTVLVIYGDYKQRFSPRKLIPAEIKTVGDELLLKRIKANLSQAELAVKTGLTIRKIMDFEHDRRTPVASEWLALVQLLSLNELCIHGAKL